MPTVPAFLAEQAERWFGREVTVTQTVDLGGRIREVHFQGEAIRGVSWHPGQEIKFRVSERGLRHYTPACWDAAEGRFSVLFYLHGQGPGSAWAAALEMGDRVRVLGPGGGIRLPAGERVTLLGDETAIGLFCALHGDNPELMGAVEVEAVSDLVRARLPGFAWPQREALPGLALLDQVATRPAEGAWLLVGRAQTLTALRVALQGRGVPRAQIYTKAYWAEGKAGL